MATLVLAPGAWLGGWVWSRVATDLRARGHTVYTPTLTGLGERQHLLRPEVDLELHATDIVRVLEYEDLQRVTLVGHGYAGAVVQRVQARLPERIARLFLLDALLVTPGATLEDTLAPAAAGALRARLVADSAIPVFAPDASLLLDRLTRRDADWVEERLTPMPAAPFAQSVDLPVRGALAIPTVFVQCLGGDPSASVALARQHGWTVYEIDGGHLPMIARVEPTSELLDHFVRQPAARFV